MAAHTVDENDSSTVTDMEGVQGPMRLTGPEPNPDGDEGKFVWTINNYSQIHDKKHYSDVFVVGGHKWRILCFPKGNNADHLSLYLDVADASEQPFHWSRYASFTLVVTSQFDPTLNIKKEATHHFNQRESDWGFTQFMSLSDLHDPHKGYLHNDTLTVDAQVSVRKQEFLYTYDSKKETGYVGLKNQGATCYMNSLLQTLFHIPYFRKTVYLMPTTMEDQPHKSIPLALQSLFYKIQFHANSVASKDLTRSFGWDTYDSFIQHDVQELNRVLCEKLEEKMKSTVVEGTIQDLFEGHIVNYIECVNVDYKSTRKEAFQDLQLDVKGCKNIYDSFNKYVEVENLDGENKYRAEGHGLQDARKGVLFEDLPPVLELQLKRFEYDFQRDTMVKINERYEFPLELDLDIDNRKYLTKTSDPSVRNLYQLHSVLVHSGGIHGGHYYAFIRPDLGEQWYRFDDERVTKEDKKRAVDDQFGGDDDSPNPGFNNPPSFKCAKQSNAYMLVYIRVQDAERICCPVSKDDIAEHLHTRMQKEQEEKERKRKEKSEAHLYTFLKVARPEDLHQQIGKTEHFDLVDHEKVKSFRIQKQTSFQAFKDQIAQEWGVPRECQRFWLWAKRQNSTYRPSRPLQPAEEALSVVQIKDAASNQGKPQTAFLNLLLEVNYDANKVPRPPPAIGKGDIILFFKLYDPVAETLSYLGHLLVNSSSRMMDVQAQVCQMAGYGINEDILMYEEIKFEPSVMCEAVDKKNTLRVCQLEDGDIICIQRNTEGLHPTPTYPTVPDFLEYIRNRQVVHFRKLEKPKDEDVVLELSKQHTYDQICEKLAKELGVMDPTCLRLTMHNVYSHMPKPAPFKFQSVGCLSDMLMSDILYYEILDLPLPELEQLKTLKVAFHNSKTELVSEHSIRLPKESCVEDVLRQLEQKLKEAPPPGENKDGEADNKAPAAAPVITGELRMLEVCYHRIYKVFQPQEKIESIDDQYWTLRIEEIPAEEKKLAATDRVINVYHFTQDPNHTTVVHNFGEPFFLRVSQNETLAEVKTRIQNKLQVPQDLFSKWKFAFCSLGRPEYLEESDIVSSKFAQSRKDWGGQWEHYLGLDHDDKFVKRPASNQNNRFNYEKPVKIWN